MVGWMDKWLDESMDRWDVYSSTHSFFHSFIYLLIQSFIQSLIYLFFKAIEFEMKRIEVIETEKTLREQEYSAELENAKSTDIVTYPSILEKIRKLREKDNQKHHSMIRKQDKLLFVSFYILLNLAEDLIVEKKMMKKQLINLISMTLTRRFEDLLILCVTFLKVW